MRRFLASIGKLIGSARSYITDFAVIAAFALIVGMTILQLPRSAIIIEEVAAPQPLLDMGYSGKVAAYRLWDSALFVNDSAGTVKGRKSLLADVKQPDIVAPGTGVSLSDVVQMLRSLLGWDDTRVAGAFVCGDEKCTLAKIELRLQVTRGGRLTSTTVGPLGPIESEKDLDRYFDCAAIALMRLIDPYIVASFFYEAEFGTPDQRVLMLAKAAPGPEPAVGETRTEAEAKRILRTGEPDSIWAANLIGVIEMDVRERPARARFWYEKALDLAEFLHLPDRSLFLTNEAHALKELGDTDQARQRFREAIYADPAYASAYKGLGEILLLDDPEAARKAFAQAVRVDPSFTPAYISWGNSLIDAGDTDAACDVFGRAARATPAEAGPHARLGACYAAQGLPDQAAQSFRDALEVDPSHAYTFVEWARSEWNEEWAGRFSTLQAGRWAQPGDRENSSDVESFFDKLRRAAYANPRYPYTYTNWGWYLRKVGQPEAADLMYARAARLKPYSAWVMRQWGESLLWLDGNIHAAIEKYQIALQRDPDDTDSRIALARALADKGDDPAAQAAYEIAARSKAGTTDGNLALLDEIWARGSCELSQREAEDMGERRKTGFCDLVLRQLDEAVGVDPHDGGLRIKLAGRLWKADRKDEAIAQYDAATAPAGSARPVEWADHGEHREPTDAEEDHQNAGTALVELAEHLWNDGRHAEALQRFANAADLDPADTEVRMHFAWHLVEGGDTRQALRENASALQLAPEEASLWGWRADTLWDDGQRTEALAGYRRAAERDVSYRLALADHLWLLEDRAEAIEQYVIHFNSPGSPVDVLSYDPEGCLKVSEILRSGQIDAAVEDALATLRNDCSEQARLTAGRP
jgi:tetratricopeptide (TPR) repeat protein